MHLLQFCMSNQCVGLQEDAANKPWRPIPSRRITVAAARHLRWALLAVCLVLSARSGVLLASAGLAFATLAYNELRLDSHWASRHVCNALGYAAFNAGATYVGCSGESRTLYSRRPDTHAPSPAVHKFPRLPLPSLVFRGVPPAVFPHLHTALRTLRPPCSRPPRSGRADANSAP